MFTLCFTGHRPDKLGGYNENNQMAVGIKKALAEEIERLASDGFTEFISGGALGVDTWAAEAVLEVKKTHPLIKLTIARPFPSQDSKWIQESKYRFKAFCDAADTVFDVSPDPYSPQKMQIRNQWMVDHADMVMAIWDGSSGGTGNCVAYAKQVKKRIFVIHPTTLKRSEI
jgi:uncharacterized phage-like protein YoqJ